MDLHVFPNPMVHFFKLFSFYTILASSEMKTVSIPYFRDGSIVLRFFLPALPVAGSEMDPWASLSQ